MAITMAMAEATTTTAITSMDELALLHLLNGVMLQLDRATAKAQHASLVQFLLGVLDRRGEA